MNYATNRMEQSKTQPKNSMWKSMSAWGVLGAGESANAALRERAAGQGVELWFEAFADRAYDARGRLVPRSEPGAVHTDVDRVLRQVKEIAEQGQVSTLDGGIIPLQADTLCLHGDNEQLLAAVGRIRAALS
jgi:UPF0271 protein